MKLKCLRTLYHVGDAWHRPLRNITIERWCIIERCSNHSITIIQKKKKRQEQIPKKKKIGNNISDKGFCYYIIETIRKNTTKKGNKNWNWNDYVLRYMVVTLDTAHFEISLLNTDALRNAVQIIQLQ